MKIRPAKVSEMEEVAHLQQIVFRPNEPDSTERYLAYAQGDSTYSLNHSRVVEVDGQIVAHLRIWDRTMRIKNADVFAAGIGSLCVHPDHRKRGYAQALMQDTEQYFFDANYDIGLLFTIIGTPFYEAMNWIPVDLPLFRFGQIDEPREGLNFRQLDVEKDLDAVMNIYDVSGLRYTGAVIRDRAYWTDAPARIRRVFPNWGIEQDGELVAYVNFEKDDEELWVKEACAWKGEALAYADLAGLILHQCEGRRLEGSLPRGHAFVHTLETMSHQTATWDTYDDMMVKGVNWNRLREKLGADLVPDFKPDSEKDFWSSVLGSDAFYWPTDIF